MPDPIEDETEPETPVEPEAPVEDDPDAPVEGEDALGDPGKRALETTKAKYKAERAKRLALEQQLHDATTPKDGAPTPEQIRRDAIREANAKANLRIVKAEIKAAAAGRFEDPADAIAFLELDTFDVDDDGEIDPEDIENALVDLLARKPHLAKQNLAPHGGSKRRIPEVPADPAGKQPTPVSHADQVEAARKAGDWKRVIALENQLLETK